MIVSDHDTEFASNAILAWAKKHQPILDLATIVFCLTLDEN